MSAVNNVARLLALSGMLLIPGLVQAQDASGSAFGESIDLSVDSAFSLVTVDVESGPLPSVSGSTPPPYNTSSSLLSVDVNANIVLAALVPAAMVDILETGTLNVSTTGDASPQSDSSASVEDVNLEILGNILLPLVLGLEAEAIESTATAGGSCKSGLTASGTTTLVGASLASTLAQLAGIVGILEVSPAPNTVLLDLSLLGGHLRIVLNEQIVTGDGATSRGITVNAIHITLDQLPIAAIITDVTGDVIISQSHAEVTCAEADIAVDISDSPDPVEAGQDLVYTLEVSNDGPDTAPNVLLEQLLPPGVTFVSAVPDQGSCGEASGTLSCDLGDLASGGSTTVTVTVTPTAPGSINTSASVSSDAHDSNLADNEDSESSTVNVAPGSADLAITLTDSPDPVNAGQPLTITLDVENNGPDTAENAVVQYTLPPGITPDSVTPSVGSCDVTVSAVTCNLGTLANGATPDIVIVMTPPIPATLQHSAVISSGTDDPTPDNNTANGSTTVQAVPDSSADLSMDKSDSPDPVVVGQPLTYTLTVTNNGPDATNSVVVTDTLPASVLFQSANASQGSCNHSAGTVTCNLGALLDQAVAVVTIVVIPQEAGPVSNTAAVASDIDDPDPDDNSDQEDSTVNPGSSDLSMTKTASANPVLVGDTFTYTLSVFNDGPDSATMVVVTDDLPDSLDFGSALPSQGSCNELNNLVTCQLGTIPNQGSANVVITVTPTVAGPLANVAVVDSQLDDPNPDDNEEEEETDVDPRRADLGLSKTSSMDPAFVDVPFDYILNIYNDGPQEATLVELEDEIPGNLVIGTITASQGSCNASGNTVTCALGTINAGASVNVTIEVTPTALGTLNNTAVVDSETEDPDISDNTATDTTEVATGRAAFGVTKVFSDGNPGEVEVSIDCNTGLILDQVKLISPSRGVIFVVTDYTSGTLDCTITEAVPAGYVPDYFDGTASSPDSCSFTDIESNEDFTCVITNTVQAVPVAIEKQWIYEGSANGVDEGYELLVECDGEIVGGETSCGPETPAGFDPQTYSCLLLQGEGNAVFPVEVIPNYPSSSCQVTEHPYDDAVEINNGCQDLTVWAGQGASCLVTNTVYFEGIPVLDMRGLILLSVLMLGMGLLAFRRMGV
jgi:uncharacterized repeat protein (TIGR01451 family)